MLEILVFPQMDVSVNHYLLLFIKNCQEMEILKEIFFTQREENVKPQNCINKGHINPFLMDFFNLLNLPLIYSDSLSWN